MFGTAKNAAEAYDLAAIQAKHSTSDLNFPDMIHLKKKIPKIIIKKENIDVHQQDRFQWSIQRRKEVQVVNCKSEVVRAVYRSGCGCIPKVHMCCVKILLQIQYMYEI